MTLSQPNPKLDTTIPDDERYPMMRSLVDDLERYINPATNTPSRHEPVEESRRFYIVDDNVYVGQSLAHELAARRNSPLLQLDEDRSYPNSIYTGTDDLPALTEFLAESAHREVIVCLPDVSTIPTDSFQAITALLDNCTFDPTAHPHTAHLETPSTHDSFSGSWTNLIVVASEPSDTFLEDACTDIKHQFDIRVDPDLHDGYSDKAFSTLDP